MHNLSTTDDEVVEFFYFTCRRDFEVIKPSLKLLRYHYPDAVINLIVDCYDPMTTAEENYLIDAFDVDIHTSTFPRRGNLKGGECLKGMWETMDNIARSPIVVKIDSDVLLLKTDWIDAFHEDHTEAEMVGACSIDTPYYPQGTMYAVRRGMVAKMAKDARRFPAWFDCWEDYEVGYRVARNSECPESSILRYKHQKDWLACPPLDFHNETIANELAKVKVYSVDYLTVQNKPADIPSAKASYMNLFVEWWLKDKHNIGDNANA